MVHLPFSETIPTWMIKFLNNHGCGSCRKKITKENIMSVGIRKVKKKTTPFVEYKCQSCNHHAIQSFAGHKTGTMEEMCYMFIQEIQNKRRTIVSLSEGMAASGKKGKITKKEADEFIKQMKSVQNFDDLLALIGASKFMPKPK